MSFIIKCIIFLILLCVCLVILISNVLYHKLQKYHLKQEEVEFMAKQLATQTPDDPEDIMDIDLVLRRFQKTHSVQDKILEMDKRMKEINEKQHIQNSKVFPEDLFEYENTVLVVKVHSDIRYMAVFLDSIRRMKFITKSLLIFAHDFYSAEINSILKRLPFARIMQVFYPYSIQVYPNIYPGRDARFCPQLDQCISSSKRNATLAQGKLFWWWVTNHVFDHIEILHKYDGYIYFLDSEQYLTSDFIHMARMLERLQPLFCPECRILSLRAGQPRRELYSQNSTFLISPWGPPGQSNSAIGFNRQTWYEIKTHKHEYCHFNDSSWEQSLRHVASQLQQKQFLMLSVEGSRAFPTQGCGAFRNGTRCNLDVNFRDITEFLTEIREGLYPVNFKVRRESDGTNGEESSLTGRGSSLTGRGSSLTGRGSSLTGRGEWEDARDKEFCIFFASRSSRTYYH